VHETLSITKSISFYEWFELVILSVYLLNLFLVYYGRSDADLFSYHTDGGCIVDITLVRQHLSFLNWIQKLRSNEK